MKQSLIKRIYTDLYDAFKGVTDGVYFGRPKTINESYISFIEITLPSEISDIVAGGTDFVLSTYAVVNLYVKAKSDSTMNVGKQTELTQVIQDKFPIKGEVIVASRPTIQMMGYDGYGFNVTQFLFKVRTLINVNNNQ
ncbi:MAG: hypothetical protein SOW01_07640 [Mediterranea sp.]|nr:hypothetical protein [Mediterranea sp.]